MSEIPEDYDLTFSPKILKVFEAPADGVVWKSDNRFWAIESILPEGLPNLRLKVRLDSWGLGEYIEDVDNDNNLYRIYCTAKHHTDIPTKETIGWCLDSLIGSLTVLTVNEVWVPRVWGKIPNCRQTVRPYDPPQPEPLPAYWTIRKIRGTQ